MWWLAFLAVAGDRFGVFHWAPSQEFLILEGALQGGRNGVGSRFRARIHHMEAKISEVVAFAIPVSLCSCACVTPLASIRWRSMSASEAGAMG